MKDLLSKEHYCYNENENQRLPPYPLISAIPIYRPPSHFHKKIFFKNLKSHTMTLVLFNKG